MKYHRGIMKYIVSVSKTSIHRGYHRHKSKTKKRWFIYYYDEEGNFCSQRVSFLEALYYKLTKCHRVKALCGQCGNEWRFVIKRGHKPICPECNEEIEQF